MVNMLRFVCALAGYVLTTTIVTACGGSTSEGGDGGVKPGAGGSGGGAANGGSGVGTGGVCKAEQSSGGCNACKCVEGQWLCTDVYCPPDPVCKDGETKTDGCNSCSCSAGQWTCTHRACPPEVDAGAPKSCWGFPGTTCTASEYCAYKDGEYCGAADATSTCQPRPKACSKIYSPVCGCDGKTYSNECEAAASGAGVYVAHPCPEPSR